MCQMRSIPLGRDTDAAVDENGVAYDLRRETWGIQPTQVKVYVGGLSFVGFSKDGSDDSPIPAASTTNSVYQESGTEETYTLSGNPKSDREKWMYVYAVDTSTTHAVRVSVFG